MNVNMSKLSTHSLPSGDHDHGWTTVSHKKHGQHQFGSCVEPEAQLEAQDRAAIAAWDNDAQWPGM